MSTMANLLHLPDNPVNLHERMREGIPASIYTDVGELLGLRQDELARLLNISPRTMMRHRGKAVPTAVANRIHRILDVYDAALLLADENAQAARAWLNTPLPALGGQRPLDLLDTEAGTNTVLSLIAALSYGMVP